jgi:hypothetical protein
LEAARSALASDHFFAKLGTRSGKDAVLCVIAVFVLIVFDSAWCSGILANDVMFHLIIKIKREFVRAGMVLEKSSFEKSWVCESIV